MNLHEYQAKALFAEYGIAVPNNRVVENADAADEALNALGGSRWVVKAQVHAGGRGKAGGVKITDSKAEVVDAIKSMLGTNLVTFQTDAKGQPINQVMIETPCNIERELYLGMVIDRSLKCITVMASTEGGMEIEKVAEETPEKILKIPVHPMGDVIPYQGRKLAFGLGLEGKQVGQFVKMLTALVRLFKEKDLSLMEINPLVLTKEGDILCLDGKINIDDNALYRHDELQALRDTSQEDAREAHASEWDLNYIALDGNIGCMVNGAGLAMATMDLIKLQGGEPANFLDVGGTADKERVAEAFKIILSDDKVKGVLVNIFGGIVRCDMIAEGVIGAIKEVGIQVPVVVHLEGNNAARGLELLEESGLDIIAAKGLKESAVKIVEAVAAAK